MDIGSNLISAAQPLFPITHGKIQVPRKPPPSQFAPPFPGFVTSCFAVAGFLSGERNWFLGRGQLPPSPTSAPAASWSISKGCSFVEMSRPCIITRGGAETRSRERCTADR